MVYVVKNIVILPFFGIFVFLSNPCMGVLRGDCPGTFGKIGGAKLPLVISSTQLEEFGSDEGALRVLKGLARQLNLSFVIDGGYKRVCQEIVMALPDCDEKTDLLAQLELWKFSKTDGHRARSPKKTQYTQPRNRGYKTLLETAKIWNLRKPADAPKVETEALHTKEGAAALLKALGLSWIDNWFENQRNPLTLSESELAEFGSAEGALPLFEALAENLRFSFSDYWGQKKTCQAIVNALPDGPKRTQLLSDLETWNFTERDGAKCKLKDKALYTQARNRAHKTLLEVARIWNESKPLADPVIETNSLFTHRGASELFTALNLPWQKDESKTLILTGSDLTEFGSSNGALPDLKRLAMKLDFPFRTPGGFENTCKAIVDALPPSRQKRELIQRFNTWNFFDSDGMTSQSQEKRHHTRSRNRAYRTLLETAKVWNETKPPNAREVSLTGLHTKEGVRSLLLVLGFRIFDF